MRRGTVTALRTPFLNAIDDGDEMLNCMENSFNEYEYFIINMLSLTDVFATESNNELRVSARV